MAKRRRYKDIERLLTSILIADAVVFVMYLLFAALGITALKVVTAIIAIVGSVLCLGYLYLIGEFKKARSWWMVLGFGCIILCLVVSLVLNYPAPAIEAAVCSIG